MSTFFFLICLTYFQTNRRLQVNMMWGEGKNNFQIPSVFLATQKETEGPFINVGPEIHIYKYKSS